MDEDDMGMRSYYTQHQHPHQHRTASATSNGVFSPSSLVYPHTVSGRAPEPVKRKRGRPRKYASAAPTSASPSPAPPPLTPPFKKEPSSAKKAQLVALGVAGQGFTPHVITVAAGEDVAQKIMSFTQQRKHAVCILSASGSISNASLRQPSMLGGNVTYEGRFEILSMSGSFVHSEIGGASSRTGGLSMCLSDADGRIVGGGVGGPLKAAGPVQVIAGSFMIDNRKDLSAAGKVESSASKLPAPVVGGVVSPTNFRSMLDSSGRISARLNEDHQNIGGGFLLQPRAMHMPSPSTDWRGGHVESYSRNNADT
eukprot:TRINITY_DN8148_c0_g2_i2.p1 TRINITY_DN8148_c0_g2~~TRINITY_DN8148_c0_g2_i2.p1  ORF type:complete len:311 (+),score=33.00 TRINITY_DN8148_c0_g2_i2:79-1011(+)